MKELTQALSQFAMFTASPIYRPKYVPNADELQRGMGETPEVNIPSRTLGIRRSLVSYVEEDPDNKRRSKVYVLKPTGMFEMHSVEHNVAEVLKRLG